MGEALHGVAVVDVETTGLGEAVGRLDGIVQVGIAWLSATGPQAWSMVCNPGEPYLRDGRAAEALAVSRLPVLAIRAAPAAQEAAGRMQTLLGRLADAQRGLTLHAFNAAFDRSFLSQPPWDLDRARWGPCLMRTAAAALRSGGAERIALRRACEGLGIPFDPTTAHDAAADALAALRIWQELRRRGAL